MNGRARRVRGRLRTKLERAAPGMVRFTTSLDHAREVIRAELRRGLDLIVLGGGDGTVVMGLTLIAEACRGLGRSEPAVGILRLGSGNAFADTVGASRDPVADLARLIHGEGTWWTVPLLDVLGVRAPFVGIGLDAQLLEDHHLVGAIVDRVPVARRLGGASRYAISVATRSIPRFATVTRPNATVRNLGAPAIEMGRGGPTGRTVASGDVLWSGAVTMVAGATIPFFGFGLKMFAFGGARADRFQLRCADGGFFETMRAVPSAFRGDYFSEHTHDFLCDRVNIELDVESAVEAGGELLGRRRQLDLALAKPVTLVALAKDPS